MLHIKSASSNQALELIPLMQLDVSTENDVAERADTIYYFNRIEGSSYHFQAFNTKSNDSVKKTHNEAIESSMQNFFDSFEIPHQ